MKREELEEYRAYFDEFDKKLGPDRHVEGSLLAAIGLLLVESVSKQPGFLDPETRSSQEEKPAEPAAEVPAT